MNKNKIYILILGVLLNSCTNTSVNITPENKNIDKTPSEVKTDINNPIKVKPEVVQINPQAKNNVVRPYSYNDKVKDILSTIKLNLVNGTEKITASSIDDQGNILLFSNNGQVINISNFSEIKNYNLKQYIEDGIRFTKIDVNGNGIITSYQLIGIPEAPMELSIRKINNFQNSDKTFYNNIKDYFSLKGYKPYSSMSLTYSDSISGNGSLMEINGAEVIFTEIKEFNKRQNTKTIKIPNDFIFARNSLLNEKNNGFLLTSDGNKQYSLVKVVDNTLSETGIKENKDYDFVQGNLDENGNGYLITPNLDNTSNLYKILNYEIAKSSISINHKISSQLSTKSCLDKDGNGFILEEMNFFKVTNYVAASNSISLIQKGIVGPFDIGQIKVNKFGDGVLYWNEFYKNENIVFDINNPNSSSSRVGTYKPVILPIRNYELQF